MEQPTTGKGAFREAYCSAPPWDIPGPQPALVEVADQISGRVLDAGCGTGENSLYFAGRGCDVTGLDYLLKPLQRAEQKAQERRLSLTLRHQSALELINASEVYDCIIDCGLLHVFNLSDRACYVQGLAHVLKPGGKLFVLCFSDAEPEGKGPRRLSRIELETSFQAGWKILGIDAVRFSVRSDLPEGYFSSGGPHAWRLIAERL